MGPLSRSAKQRLGVVARLPGFTAAMPWVKGYRLTYKIGSGGFAEVWEARKGPRNARYAMKVLFPTGDPEAIQDFSNEAKRLQRLHHPTLVKGLDDGRTRRTNRPFLVMELADAGTLHDAMHRGELPPYEVSAAVDAVAGALAYLHENGIVHRDVKATNILRFRGTQGRFDYKLGDLGLARHVEQTKSTVLQMNYLDPDFLASQQSAVELTQGVWERLDAYALAVTALQALIVEAPGFAHRHDTDWNEFAEPSLAQVFERAFQRDSHSRYQNASDFAMDLRDALAIFGSEPGRSSEPVQPEQRRERARRAISVAKHLHDGELLLGIRAMREQREYGAAADLISRLTSEPGSVPRAAIGAAAWLTQLRRTRHYFPVGVAFVLSVAPRGQGAAAGLQFGDLLSRINGAAVTGPESLFQAEFRAISSKVMDLYWIRKIDNQAKRFYSRVQSGRLDVEVISI